MKNGDRKFLIESFKSNECHCGRAKQPKFFFCRKCWGPLHPNTKSALIFAYKAKGITSLEFLEAYDDVVKELES